MPIFARSPFRPWMLAWLFLAGFLVYDSTERFEVLTALNDVTFDTSLRLAVDPKSPSGYQFGQHRAILNASANDGYQWMLQVQKVLNGEGARIHWVDHDNAPDGRAAHWSSGFVWWMAALSWIDGKVTGRPAVLALETVALYANTLFVGLVILALIPVVARRMGGTAATAVAFGVIDAYPFYDTWVVGYPDHHGIVNLLAMLTGLFLLTGGGGWTRTPLKKTRPAERPWLLERRAARRWFIASAVAGGAALWVSAATQALALIGIGLGAFSMSIIFARRKGEGWAFDPTLWRAWGVTGALTSLGFYLLEYFPGNWSLRLEVNHPLYALAWYGAGEFLCRCGQWRQGAARHRGPGAIAALAGSLLAGAILPLVILATKERSFIISDPFLWNLHADYINEFRTFGNYCSTSDAKLLVFLLAGGIPLLGALTLLLAAVRRLEAPWKALIMLGWCPAMLTLAFGLYEIRWISLASVFATAVLSLAGAMLDRHTGKWWKAGRLAFVMLFVAASIPSARECARRWGTNVVAAPADYATVITRDIAHQLRQRTGKEPAIVLSDPTTTTSLIFFGGLRGMGTLYWENRDGLRASAEIAGATTNDEALTLLGKHRVKYIVMVSWSSFTEQFGRLLHGLRVWQPAPRDTFFFRLQNNSWPFWLRPIPYRMPSAEYSALVFEVVPGQTPLEAMVRCAHYQLAMGRPDDAAKLLQQALATDPNFLPALVLLAESQHNHGDAEGFVETMARVRRLLPAPETTGLADRINLAWTLMNSGNRPSAKTEFQAALDRASESSVRELDAVTLDRFLFLHREWPLPMPAGLTFESVMRLLPTSRQVVVLRWLAERQLAEGRAATALATLEEALQLKPQDLNALRGKAWILAVSPDERVRDAALALDAGQRALALEPDSPATLDIVACAQAASGNFPAAVQLEKKALDRAEAKLQPGMRARLARFEKGEPWLAPAPPGNPEK